MHSPILRPTACMAFVWTCIRPCMLVCTLAFVCRSKASESAHSSGCPCPCSNERPTCPPMCLPAHVSARPCVCPPMCLFAHSHTCLPVCARSRSAMHAAVTAQALDYTGRVCKTLRGGDIFGELARTHARTHACSRPHVHCAFMHVTCKHAHSHASKHIYRCVYACMRMRANIGVAGDRYSARDVARRSLQHRGVSLASRGLSIPCVSPTSHLHVA